MFESPLLAKAARGLRGGMHDQRHMVGAMALKFGGAAASFAITFVIARVYGAAVSGEYALFAQTAAIFSTVAVFGNEQMVVRRIAGNLADRRKDLARLSYEHATRIVGFRSAAAAVLLLLLVPLAGWIGITAVLIGIAALSVLFRPLMTICAAAVRGAHYLVHSQLLLNLQPMVMLALTLAVVTFWPGRPAIGLALSYDASVILVTVLAMLAVRRLMVRWPRADQQHPDDGRTNSTKLGLTIAVDMACMWAALVLTGALMGLAEAGVFRVCMQVMTVMVMFVTTHDGLISPRFASLFRQGDFAAAGRLQHRSAAFLLLTGGVPLLFIAVFAEPLLGLIGEEFRNGATALRILAVGLIAAMASGGAGAMITMNGHEAFSLKLAIVSFVVVIAVMLLLTPYLGINGAALAMSLTWIIRYFGSYVYARRMVRLAK